MGQGLSPALALVFVNPKAVSSLRSAEIEFRLFPPVGWEIPAVAEGTYGPERVSSSLGLGGALAPQLWQVAFVTVSLASRERLSTCPILVRVVRAREFRDVAPAAFINSRCVSNVMAQGLPIVLVSRTSFRAGCRSALYSFCGMAAKPRRLN